MGLLHVFRYDDFSAISDSRVEEQLFDIFLKLRIPITVAVIPFVCNPSTMLQKTRIHLAPVSQSKVNLVKPLLDSNLAEIALHGYSHLAMAPMRDYQEFSSSMPVSRQRELIRHGRSYLEDIFSSEIELFVPPWNRLDYSTALVLYDEGMLLSADIHLDQQIDLSTSMQVPCATTPETTSRALRTALRWKGSHVVGTMLHDYDFIESGYSAGKFNLDNFETVLSTWGKSKNVQHELITQYIHSNRGFSSDQYSANKSLRSYLQSSYLARRVLRDLNLVYWDISTAEHFERWIRLLP